MSGKLKLHVCWGFMTWLLFNSLKLYVSNVLVNDDDVDDDIDEHEVGGDNWLLFIGLTLLTHFTNGSCLTKWLALFTFVLLVNELFVNFWIGDELLMLFLFVCWCCECWCFDCFLRFNTLSDFI